MEEGDGDEEKRKKSIGRKGDRLGGMGVEEEENRREDGKKNRREREEDWRGGRG